MIDLGAIGERLSAPPAILALVEGAARFRQVKGAPAAHLMPAAWVVPVRDDAGPRRAVNVADQRVGVTFGVVLAVGDRSDPRGGGAARDALLEVRRAVAGRLIGWTPEGACGAVEYAGGEIIDVETACVWWMDRYRGAVILKGA